MVHELVDGNRQGEVDRVPRAGLELQRCRRRLDMSVAPAAVLLAENPVDHEPPLGDGDLFARFELTRNLAQAEPALRTGHVGLVEAQDHVLDGKGELLGGSVPLVRLLGPGHTVASLRRLLAGVAEEGLVAKLQELTQVFKLHLDRLGATALESDQLLGKLFDTLDEAIVLPLEKEGDLLEESHVALGADVDCHTLYIFSNGASNGQQGWRLSQDVRSRAERVAAHELGALKKELQLGESHPHGIAMRKTPRSREGAALEPLGPHAESRTVPMEHFGPLAVATDVHEEVPAQRIAAEPFGNDRGEAIEGFPHIDRLRVDPH